MVYNCTKAMNRELLRAYVYICKIANILMQHTNWKKKVCNLSGLVLVDAWILVIIS